MSTSIADKILEKKLIAIMRGVEASACSEVASALNRGGFELIEVTFNQADSSSFRETQRSIEIIANSLDQKVVVGAGTVLTIEQVILAYEAGAKYIISPNTNKAVIEKTKELGLLSLPGVLTPSEAVKAYVMGADYVKIFPAGNLGASYIKSICAPVSHIPMIAVGGIHKDNVNEFLCAGCVGAGIGGCLVNKELAAKKLYREIEIKAKDIYDAII